MGKFNTSRLPRTKYKDIISNPLVLTDNRSDTLIINSNVEKMTSSDEFKGKFFDIGERIIALGGQIVSYLHEKEKTLQIIADCEKEKVKAIEETKQVYLQCSARIQESQDSLKKTLAALEHAEKESQRGHEAKMKSLNATISEFIERGKQLRDYSDLMKKAALENNTQLFNMIKTIRDAEAELYKLSQQKLG